MGSPRTIHTQAGGSPRGGSASRDPLRRVPGQGHPPAFLPSEVQRLVALLLKPSDRPCEEMVAELAGAGVPFESLVVDLLAPATREIGHAWTEDRVSFFEAGIAYGRVQQILRRLSQADEPADVLIPPRGRLLLTVAEGESHTLGLLALAEILLRQHWDVVLGRPILEATPATLVSSEAYDAVLFSAAQTRSEASLKRESAEVRRRSSHRTIRILLGGQLGKLEPQAWQRIGADAVGDEAIGVSELLAGLLPSASADHGG
ncbi:MAG: cobalamin B12-binding domain-containing protein [Gemmatimonadetes bacterium]|nr:cobalamin B12-binding domain-containing protein [Gemmatimonadota bacterium]